MNNHIDLTARKRLCGLMRQFVIGRINSDEFDTAYEGILTSDRTANRIVLETFAYYNENRIVRLAGKYRLSHAERRQVARWILFLQSGQEYLERKRSWDARLREIGNWMAGGLIARGKENEEYDDYAQHLWPFTTQADLDEARRHPKLLSQKG